MHIIYLMLTTSTAFAAYRKYHNKFPATPWFAHTHPTHPNNMIYLSPEDE